MMKNSLLTQEQKELIDDGNHLLTWTKNTPKEGFSDYSFLVAPFAKAFEGFLKVFFLKMGMITLKQYQSDRFRVGKVLNPALQDKKWSVYRKLKEKKECQELAEQLWQAWRNGRNLIFHYFPHNLHRLSFEQAEERIKTIKQVMSDAQKILNK